MVDPTGQCSKKDGSDTATDDPGEPCVEPTSVTVSLNDSLEPLEVVDGFLAGRFPDTLKFSEASTLSIELLRSRHVLNLLYYLQSEFNNCRPPKLSGDYPRNLGKFNKPTRVARMAGDALNAATKGATGNLTASILGSYDLSYSISNVDEVSGKATINMTVTNDMTFESLFRNPLSMKGTPRPEALAMIGAMKPVRMELALRARIGFNDKGCPAMK